MKTASFVPALVMPQSCPAVAQISNLLCRGFPIRKPGKVCASANRRRPAEWNSAIQQIENLRYESGRSTQPRLEHYQRYHFAFAKEFFCF